MFRTSRLIPLALLTLVAACSDTSGPLTEGPQTDASHQAPHFLAWNTDAPVQFTATAENAAGEIALVAPPHVSALVTNAASDTKPYTASFWAVRGEKRYVQIDYETTQTSVMSLSAAARLPFVRLDVSSPAVRPDGSVIAVGDSIMITLVVDPADMVVHLEPSGLQFGNAPAVLQMWYTGTSGDLNGDGVVDKLDHYLENELGLWFQADWDNPWSEIKSAHSPDGDYFRAWLEHFSGYAISW